MGLTLPPLTLPDTDAALVTPGSALRYEGQIFIEPQGLMAMAGVGLADGRTVAVDRTALWWAETTLELLGEESEAAVARVAMRWDAALRLREH